MRPRILASVVTLVVAAGVFAVVSSAPEVRAAPPTTPPAPPPATTSVTVEVEGKQVERSPEKEPARASGLPRTGPGHAGTLVLVGLLAVAAGMVLLDHLAPVRVPERTALPRRLPYARPRRRTSPGRLWLTKHD